MSYYGEVRPILQRYCQGCHQPAKAKGQLDVTTYEALLRGGDSDDPCVAAGKPDDSVLIAEVTPEDGEASMPKNHDPLSAEQVAVLRRWIAEGAKDDTPAGQQVLFSMEQPPTYANPPAVTSLALFETHVQPGIEIAIWICLLGAKPLIIVMPHAAWIHHSNVRI